MSAVAGIYNLDGRPVESTVLEQMVASLAHRGPDGAGVWRSGSVGLGHRMLWTTPESLGERLPLVNRGGDLAITADARIDNRDELIHLLGLSGRSAGEISDSELILDAYKRWGERCPERLLGDFSFAIWDGRKRALFCARDPFGVKPFYYYRSERLFCFASEIKALFCLPEVPRRLNETRVAYHFEPALRLADTDNTWYRDIHCLSPSRAMTVSTAGTRSEAYWSWDAESELVLGSDDEYAEAFREVFGEAVRCRLRSAYPVGTELSGGLDSSSVTCIAHDSMAERANGRLHTFSAVYDEVPECDERSFIDAVVAHKDVDAHFVHVDRLSPFVGLDRYHWVEDQPLFTPNTFLHWGLFRACREQGVRVLLDGEDGDGIVSYGYTYLSELARAHQWADFSEELEAFGQRHNGSFWPALSLYGLPHLTELARGFRWAAFARGVRGLSKHLGVSKKNLVLNYGLKRLVPERARQAWHALLRYEGTAASVAPAALNPALDRGFVRRIGLESQALEKRHQGSAQSVREEQYTLFTSGAHAIVNEITGSLATDFGIELRHPFFDRRLAAFCLALPPQQKLHQGWNRVVMRRAMDRILPQKVQWRVSKTDLGPGFGTGLLKFERERLDTLILDELGLVGEYVDLAVVRAAYQKVVDRADSGASTYPVWRDAAIVLWPAVSLALWLRHTGLTP